MRGAFVQALCEAATDDDRIWLLSGDLGYNVLNPFIDAFSDRYVNAGVAESNMVGVATGLALSGKVVFIYSIVNFATVRCLEQIRNDACYHGADVKIVAVGGGFVYGTHGYTHHGVEDLAIMRALPGMVVVAPGDPVETRLATHAIASAKGPCYLRLGRGGEPVIHTAEPPFELGKATVLREGADVTIITTGGMLADGLAASEQLAGEGITAGLVSMHTLKPVDAEAIVAAAKRSRGIITLEEHGVVGGLGDSVADVLARSDRRPVSFAKLGVPDRIDARAGSRAYMADFVTRLPDIARHMAEGTWQ